MNRQIVSAAVGSVTSQCVSISLSVPLQLCLCLCPALSSYLLHRSIRPPCSLFSQEAAAQCVFVVCLLEPEIQTEPQSQRWRGEEGHRGETDADGGDGGGAAGWSLDCR